MIDGRLLLFVAVMAALIATPGPDMALATRNALRGGRRAAVLTAIGVGAGAAIWATAAAFGIATVLAASAVAFTILKFGGGAYLVGLGLLMLIRSRTPQPEPAPRVGNPVLQGFLNNLLNPKAAAIFVTLFPQFIQPGDGWPRLLLMVAIFEVMLVGWLCLYGFVVVAASRRIGERAERIFSRITGVVLIGLGVRLATART